MDIYTRQNTCLMEGILGVIVTFTYTYCICHCCWHLQFLYLNIFWYRNGAKASCFCVCVCLSLSVCMCLYLQPFGTCDAFLAIYLSTKIFKSIVQYVLIDMDCSVLSIIINILTTRRGNQSLQLLVEQPYMVISSQQLFYLLYYFIQMVNLHTSVCSAVVTKYSCMLY